MSAQDPVCLVLLGLRVRASATSEAWDVLEHAIAPVALSVDGVRDLRLPRSRDITMVSRGEADCELRVSVSTRDDDSALALSDGALRDALSGLAPVISVASVTAPVSGSIAALRSPAARRARPGASSAAPG